MTLWSISGRKSAYCIFAKLRKYFLKGTYSIGIILGIVGPISLKWNERATIRCLAKHVTSTFDLDHAIEFFRGQIYKMPVP